MTTSDTAQAPYHTILSGVLASRGLVKQWAERTDPLGDLVAECQLLTTDIEFEVRMKKYLQAHEIVRQSFDMVISHLAMAANVRWQDLPPPFQPFALRGWHIGRWLPTFLLIDGPLGSLLRHPESPVCAVLNARHSEFPLLAAAKRAFCHDLFRRVRNGFAHWSFHWRDLADGAATITILDQARKNTLEISLLEAEALHFMSYAVVEALDNHVVRVCLPSGANT